MLDKTNPHPNPKPNPKVTIPVYVAGVVYLVLLSQP